MYSCCLLFDVVFVVIVVAAAVIFYCCSWFSCCCHSYRLCVYFLCCLGAYQCLWFLAVTYFISDCFLKQMGAQSVKDFLRRGPRGASHEKFHAAPSKKQTRFLEGSLPLRIEGKSDLLRSPFASKKVPSGTFRGLPPVAPLLLPGKIREATLSAGVQNIDFWFSKCLVYFGVGQRPQYNRGFSHFVSWYIWHALWKKSWV